MFRLAPFHSVVFSFTIGVKYADCNIVYSPARLTA